MNILSLLALLHVLSISLWIAAALWISGDVRRTLALGRPHVEALPARVRPALGLDALAALATFVTGAVLFWEQGFRHPPPGLVAGIVFAIVRVGVLAGMRRAWRGIMTRIQAGEAVPATDPAARRMSMLAGIAHLMWLLALVGMMLPE